MTKSTDSHRTDRPKILASIGTRPEMIKMAPVITELRSRSAQVDLVVLFTTQHREMLDQMAQFFGVQGDIDLDTMTEDQSLGQLTSRILSRMEPVLQAERPDMVLGQGDTTTVMATALACYYLKIPFGHVEAGLRTPSKFNPFPEELNRRLVSQLADLHFVPTEVEQQVLKEEHVPDSAIVVTGNTAVDAVLQIAERDLPAPTVVDPFKDLIVMTVHRRESLGEKILDIFAAVKEIADRRPDVQIVYPVHPNPNVRRVAYETLDGLENVNLIEPLDYGQFVALMRRATVILTDSGGIQEEAPSLGVPVLVLREVTERHQAVTAGLARLVGTNHRRIVENTLELLANPELRSEMMKPPNPFGDGKAAKRIADAVVEFVIQEGPSTRSR